MKTYIIDRFEGIYAVCEDENKDLINIPKYKLPLECKEGNYIYQDIAGMYQIQIQEEKVAEGRIREKMSRLFEHKPE